MIRLVFFFALLLWPYDGRTAQGKENSEPERPPGFFRVFSEDGSESLVVVCMPKDKSLERVVRGGNHLQIYKCSVSGSSVTIRALSLYNCEPPTNCTHSSPH